MDSKRYLCRGCMKKVLNKGRYSLLRPDIKDLFQKCTSIELSPDDPPDLPQQLCSECMSKCYQWRSFQTMCLATDATLHSDAKKQKKTRFDINNDEDMLEPESLEQDEDMDHFSSDVTANDSCPLFEETEETTPTESTPVDQLERLPDENVDTEATVESNSTHGEDQKFQCPICHKRFNELGDVRNHFVIHTEEIPFICNRCSFATQTNEDMRVHIRLEHDKVPNSEDWCIREGSIFHNERPWEAMGFSDKDVGLDLDAKAVPAGVGRRGRRAANDLSGLSEKSQKMYKKVYDTFNKWKLDNGLSAFTTEDQVVWYFEYMIKELQIAPTVLWPRFSQLRQQLEAREGLDISNFTRVKAILTKNHRTTGKKRAPTFTPKQIVTFLTTAPDSEWFLHKIITVLTICCSLRTAELRELNVYDVTIRPTEVEVRVPGKSNGQGRAVTIVSNPDFDAVKMLTDYNDIASKKKGREAFVVGMKNMVATRERVGYFKYGIIFREVAQYLGLPNAKDFTSLSGLRSSEIYTRSRKL